ncbi:MAG TPA: hypothetical protein VGD13_05990 [Xanthobacteraceae bacterium]
MSIMEMFGFVKRRYPLHQNKLGAAMAAIVLLGGIAMGAPARADDLEAGLAITDPALLQTLEKRFAMGALLFPRKPGAAELKNSELFKGNLATVGRILLSDIDSVPALSLDPTAREAFKAGGSKDQRFSAYLLNHPNSGFVLTGIVNRMDRAYRVVDARKKTRTCGEVRFIYRFTYEYKEIPDITHEDEITKFDGVPVGSIEELDEIITRTPKDKEVEVVFIRDGVEKRISAKLRSITSRLPLTATAVLNAKNPGDTITCAEIAKRWLESGRKQKTELQAYLESEAGPLRYLRAAHVDRLEMNFQLFRLPASSKPDFGGYAEYLFRVFRRTAPGEPFVVTRLENQVDRAELEANPKRLAAFKKWLLDPKNLWDLDHGTLDVPWPYLSARAVSGSPGGASRSLNGPFQGLVTSEEITQALQRYEARGTKLRTLKSAEGFNKRLNDLTCTGCHQTRGIAGFHFPGADRANEPRNNAVHVPGSAQFFGDLPRRRTVVEAFAAGKTPNFFRGFSDRPDPPFKTALAATQLFDGWGAACHQGGDKSFADWSCGAGLQCKVLHQSPHHPKMGVCVSAGPDRPLRIGDPVEFGEIKHGPFGDDTYIRIEPSGPAQPHNYVVPEPPGDRNDYAVAHQGYREMDLTGGFPAGMLRIRGSKSDPPVCPSNLPTEATCGRVAAQGFNDCIAKRKPFTECLKLTETAGLRACDSANPCREDYICTAPYDDLTPGQKRGANGEKMGTCIPPYFMFQFRADGHPKSYSVQERPIGEPQARRPGDTASTSP